MRQLMILVLFHCLAKDLAIMDSSATLRAVIENAMKE